MSSGFRCSVSITAEMAQVLYRQLEIKSMEASQNFEFRAAKSPENLALNRWHNVLPYDTTRVKLSPPYPAGKSGMSTDYINANYVNVAEADRCYILTQGPLKETVWHFWTMVHQAQSPAIVMLCRLSESGVCKCARYWPETTKPEDAASDQDSGLEIKLLSEEDKQDLIIRKIELRHAPSKTIRTVTQYHYNKWPDFGVPSEPTTFLRLLDKVAKEHPSRKDQPSIVHCSAGIGRSGTFCLVDSCLQIMNKRNGPMTRQEVLDVLLEMRLCRNGLVQTPEQLRFSLYALTVAMSTMDFTSTRTNNDSSQPEHQTNGIKLDPDQTINSTDRLRHDSNGKTSNVISVDSTSDSDDVDNENEEFFRNGDKNRSSQQHHHTRKRSTADEESSMEKEDDLIFDDSTEALVLKENGESQAKRPKSTQNKDW